MRFLITGCQRSGTTLLGMALESHPQIEMIEENDRRYHSNGVLTRELNLQAVLEKPTVDGGLTGYKAPRDSHRLDEFANALPQLRVLWIERDKYQVVASMMTLKKRNGSWAEINAPKEIKKHIRASQDRNTEQLLARANDMNDPTGREAALAGLCWAVKCRQGNLGAQTFGPRFLRIGYEELVSAPEDILRTVLTFLGLFWTPQVLNHPMRIDNRARPGGADSSRPMDRTSLDKWRAHLTAGDLELIDQFGSALD